MEFRKCRSCYALCFGCEQKYENFCDTFFLFGFPLDLWAENIEKIKRTEQFHGAIIVNYAEF